LGEGGRKREGKSEEFKSGGALGLQKMSESASFLGHGKSWSEMSRKYLIVGTERQGRANPKGFLN